MNEKIADELQKILYRDIDNNLELLIQFKVKLEERLSANKLADCEFVKYLYSEDIDEKWLLAQCQSICNQIEKISNESSLFNTHYNKILTDNDKLRLSQELIYDISYLDEITGYKLNWEQRITRPNNLVSNQFFLYAKFAYFTKKYIPELTNRHFEFSSMPMLIRQAIELKIKEMIYLKRVAGKNGKFRMIGISAILDFFINKKNLIVSPVDLELLSFINKWTNAFVHTAIIPFCWQSLEAVDIIEPLFAIEKDGVIKMHGFNYLSKNISLSALKLDLDKHFDADFTLGTN